MRNAAREERIGLGGRLVHVGVKGVAGEMREVLDVVQRDRPARGLDALADFELVVVELERMHLGRWRRRAARPGAGEAREAAR